MFRIYFGQLGQGKTYGMCRDALYALKKGHDVFWMGSDFMVPGYENQIFHIAPDEILKVFHACDYSKKNKKAVFCMDEGWLLFDSYLMTKMDLEMRVKIASLRKHKIDLYVTAQRVSAVHKAARDLCNQFWRCQTFGFGVFRIFRMSQFELDGSGNLDFNKDASTGRSRAMQTKIYLYRGKIAGYYNTMQSIGSMWDVASLSARGRRSARAER